MSWVILENQLLIKQLRSLQEKMRRFNPQLNANRMQRIDRAIPPPKTQPTQITATTASSVESPSAWMQYGTSPTEIILATAIVIGAVAGVIGAIALLLQVLVPVMRSNSSQKK